MRTKKKVRAGKGAGRVGLGLGARDAREGDCVHAHLGDEIRQQDGHLTEDDGQGEEPHPDQAKKTPRLYGY